MINSRIMGNGKAEIACDIEEIDNIKEIIADHKLTVIAEYPLKENGRRTRIFIMDEESAVFVKIAFYS